MALTLRRSTPDDAAAFAELMADPAVYGQLLQMPFRSVDHWRSRLAESTAPGKLDLPLTAELDGEVVGSSLLHPAAAAARRRHVMALGISVALGAQRRGVGTAMMSAMCDYADRWVGALRIELTVYTDNLAAIRLYERHGFQIEGTHRGYALRDGVFVDAHAMARWNPHPPTRATDPANTDPGRGPLLADVLTSTGR